MNGRTVLIVDDDEDIRACLKDILEFEGYTTLDAKDGRDALKVLSGPVRPDLILLDLMMPVMNATEFMDIKKKSETLSAIPALIMSASHLSEEKANSLKVDGHIKKPFDFDDLLETVKRFCA